MSAAEDFQPKPTEGLGFPLAMWLASRGLIALVMLGVAPGLAPPPGGVTPTLGWDVFAQWDSGWYLGIVQSGYEFAPDGKQHNVAFFPLYPLLIRALSVLGLPSVAAATLLSHLAFLAALCGLYRWVTMRLGVSAARWSCAVLAWFPTSLFASVVYAEGLFLLLSIGALYAYERGRYGLAGVCGALASATRVAGILLAPAMAWAAWREGRPKAAWGAAAFATLGLAAYGAFGAWRFGDPLAFLHAQAGWRPTLGFDAQGWLALWRDPAFRGEAFSKSLFVFGGGVLAWRTRAALGPLATAFGLLSLALILASGSTASVDRYVVAIAPLAVALGLWCSSRPRRGAAVVTVMAVLLISAALRFARGLWVA